MQEYVNKNISIAGVLAFLFVLVLTPVMAWVTSTTLASIWSGGVASQFAGGTGTSASPYLISTGEQLAFLRQVINTNAADGTNGGDYNSSTKFYAMTQDIYLNDTTNWQSWNETTTGLNQWTPIGLINNSTNPANAFKGSFNGQGYSVCGIYIMISSSGSPQDRNGLFADINGGEVMNLGVRHGFIRGVRHQGGIAGRVEEGKIANCYNLDVNITGYNTSSQVTGTGGIVGYMGIGTISNCYNTASISVSGTQQTNAGGIAGALAVATSSLVDCYNMGNIYGVDNHVLGGVAGTVRNMGGRVERCYNVGSITGNASFKGGVAGSGNTTQIINCYYSSTTSGASGTGTARTMSQMLINDTLTLYMTGLGNAWVKRPNTATQSYYPELKVFATDLI
ncbi:MAG: hypothetical protein FWE53_02265 [Firmicutes bacterium]|nr:hypothetical protein [Bacillota bacterium]